MSGDSTMHFVVSTAILDFEWHNYGMEGVALMIDEADPNDASQWEWLVALANAIVAAVTTGPEVP